MPSPEAKGILLKVMSVALMAVAACVLPLLSCKEAVAIRSRRSPNWLLAFGVNVKAEIFVAAPSLAEPPSSVMVNEKTSMLPVAIEEILAIPEPPLMVVALE